MILFLFTILTVFRVAFVGDPQVDNETELGYARKSIYSELRQRSDLDLVVVLGDLVNEKMELIAPSEASLDSLQCPWVRVKGNHDGCGPLRDSVISVGHLHIILLDNVRRTRRGYEGGLSEAQKSWLDAKVRAIPVRDRIILCAHIPFSSNKGADTLSNILSAHDNILAVCGHTHYVKRQIMDRGAEEVFAGASCGSWWRGLKDGSGIPYALMNCGAPRGYFVADIRTSGFSGKWYRLSFKAVGRTDVASAFIRGDKLIVNVFGGSIDGELEVKAPKGKWMPARHYYALAPEVEDIIKYNGTLTREYRKLHRNEFIPTRNLPSPHVWSAPAEGIAKGSTIRLRYTDGSMSFDSECVVQ